MTLVRMPGSEIGYDQITSTTSNITETTESAGHLLITCTAYVFDGLPVIAELFFPAFFADACIISLFEGATQIGRLAGTWGNTDSPVIGKLRFTPSAGSHTYKVTAIRQNTTVLEGYAGAGGTGAWVPAFVRFTKV